MLVNTLARYKQFMDRDLADIDMSKFDKPFLGRSATFKYAFEHVAKMAGTVRIVELGTSRSFVDGRYEGCNSNDIKYWEPNNPVKWDFGAGCFTYMAAEYFTTNHPDFELHTVDLCADHISRCRHMTRSFGKNIRYYVQNSLNFLATFKTRCDLIYMDTGDMTPIEPTAALQLEEAQIIMRENLLNDNGLLLIDDVRNPTALAQSSNNCFLGKAKYSIPFFKRQGLRMLMDEYQVILGR